MTTMREPTARQAEILAHIRAVIDAEGAPPTAREIADAFGLRSVFGVQKHLAALAAAGWLDTRPHRARGIRLRGAAAPAPLLQLPVLGRVAAGLPIGADVEDDEALAVDARLFSTRPDYLQRVVGDSMQLDGILDGDLIGVKRSAEARDGQIVVARLDGELTVKRLQRSARRLRLLPRNPAFAPIEIDARIDDFAIEGLYCGLIRRG